MCSRLVGVPVGAIIEGVEITEGNAGGETRTDEMIAGGALRVFVSKNQPTWNSSLPETREVGEGITEATTELTIETTEVGAGTNEIEN